MRETKEKGVNIGLPVTATDPEGADDEKLTYWLTGSSTVDGAQDTTDDNVNTFFSIDAATGQLMTNAELDRETDASYEVTVNVTDSSGVNTASIIVTIAVLELDEKPTISGASTIEHVEGTTALDIDLSDNLHDPITNNPPVAAVGLEILPPTRRLTRRGAPSPSPWVGRTRTCSSSGTPLTPRRPRTLLPQAPAGRFSS